jgi:succinate-acetate transporter protein
MSAHEVNNAAVPSQPVATAPISVPFGDPAALGLAAFALTTFVLTALLAWYGSFATVTNFTFKRTLLPLVPLAR